MSSELTQSVFVVLFSRSVIPVCKNLVATPLYQLIIQKHWYLHAYNKHYNKKKAETDFPPKFLKLLETEVSQVQEKPQEDVLTRSPLRSNVQSSRIFVHGFAVYLVCYSGEYFPPCFPDDSQGHYSICTSVCNDIVKDCPESFR